MKTTLYFSPLQWAILVAAAGLTVSVWWILAELGAPPSPEGIKIMGALAMWTGLILAAS